MSKANCCISGSSWSYHFAERSSHYLRYITQGMIEKLYRVLVDAGDMTSLQREHRKLYNTWSALGKKCPNKYKKPGQDSKYLNVILTNNDGASGYGNLFTVLSVC